MARWTYELVGLFYAQPQIIRLMEDGKLTVRKSESCIIGDEIEIASHSLPDLEVVFLPNVADKLHTGERFAYWKDGQLKGMTYGGRVEYIPIAWGYRLCLP